jgi:3-hydroxy acid dehydrogenase / malonic semialdehyde reductase
MKTVLITGATAGIGEAVAKIFARANNKVIITGRRLDRLNKLKEKLEIDFGAQIHALCFDVQKSEQVKSAISSLPDAFKDIDILVNNAGLALGRASFDNGQESDWDTMIDTNIKGILYMTKAVVPCMIEKQSGHIINIGSIAGKETYLGGNVYCATKHAVDSLTKAMRIDLLEHGIKVTGICPGIVETEFSVVRYKGDEEKAKKVYEGYHPLSPRDVAELIFFTATRPPHVNINDVVITPTTQANTYYSKKIN